MGTAIETCHMDHPNVTSLNLAVWQWDYFGSPGELRVYSPRASEMTLTLAVPATSPGPDGPPGAFRPMSMNELPEEVQAKVDEFSKKKEEKEKEQELQEEGKRMLKKEKMRKESMERYLKMKELQKRALPAAAAEQEEDSVMERYFRMKEISQRRAAEKEEEMGMERVQRRALPAAAKKEDESGRNAWAMAKKAFAEAEDGES